MYSSLTNRSNIELNGDRRHRSHGKLSTAVQDFFPRTSHSEVHIDESPNIESTEYEKCELPTFKSEYAEKLGIAGALCGAVFPILARFFAPSSSFVELDLPTNIMTCAILGCMLGTLLGCLVGMVVTENPGLEDL